MVFEIVMSEYEFDQRFREDIVNQLVFPQSAAPDSALFVDILYRQLREIMSVRAFEGHLGRGHISVQILIEVLDLPDRHIGKFSHDQCGREKSYKYCH